MNDAQRRDLTDLRAAAQQRDQQQLQFLTKRLLGQLDFYGALALIVQEVYDFTDIFESYYPDEEWIRRLLVSITSFGVAPDDAVAEMALAQSFASPGAGNFLKAVYDTTQAMQTKHSGEARISFMTSALVNAVMANLVEAWYGERADAWAHQHTNAGDPASLELAYLFWTDPQIARLDTQLWSGIADRITEAFTRL